MHCEEKLKLRSHNTSYSLIEVVTKAGLSVLVTYHQRNIKDGSLLLYVAGRGLKPIGPRAVVIYSRLFKYTHQHTAGFTENSVGPWLLKPALIPCIFALLFKSNKTVWMFYWNFFDNGDNPMDNPNIYNVEEDSWLSTDLQLLIHFLFRFNPIIAFSIPEIILLSYQKTKQTHWKKTKWGN